jgi:hypothetical protein
MKGMLSVFLFIGMTAVAWGLYGPALHEGQHRMGDPQTHAPSLLRAFTCVGLAYVGIAIVVPVVLLAGRGETGGWTARGTLWSLLAGAAGAAGALGIVMAFKNHGSPLFVMPLVFGCAPVINTFFTMYLNKNYREAGPLFFAGLILVIAGAVAVLVFKPAPPVRAGAAAAGLTAGGVVLVTIWVAVTAVCWGLYGPILHKGQQAMQGSRLRPFVCVGVSYFLMAVIVPWAILSQHAEPGGWTLGGTLWSLGGGAFGALGALGLILAFNAGGKPIYVMPLVFGLAPVVNTITTLVAKGAATAPHPLFYAGLIIVAAGAAAVLVFAPKARPHAAPAGH